MAPLIFGTVPVSFGHSTRNYQRVNASVPPVSTPAFGVAETPSQRQFRYDVNSGYVGDVHGHDIVLFELTILQYGITVLIFWPFPVKIQIE